MESVWFIEYLAADGSLAQHWLRRLPFRIGREPNNDLALNAPGLSRHHAEIAADASGGLRLVDLQSTNGSFVNREQVKDPTPIGEHDVVHLGTFEFRLRRDEQPGAAADSGLDEVTRIATKGRDLPEHFVRHEREFMELLSGKGLSGAAQPIVDVAGGHVVAYELLGRSLHPDLQVSPMQLLHLAARLDREAELSAAWRDHGVQALAPHLHGRLLFVNTHPKETFTDAFVDSLTRLRELPSRPSLVVEVHESAVVEVERMRELAARLKTIGVPFAYDDFGAGQARLNELAEVPADFVKFDMALVQDLHRANERKQRLVRDLVRAALDFGSKPLAEGVEVEADAQLCREMGFQLLQGWFTGRPVPLAQFDAPTLPG